MTQRGTDDVEAPDRGEIFQFGQFRLFPGRRLLTCADQPVRLGARAFDILLALVERAGQPVSKEQLVAIAWPHTFVDESNLRVHIAALRKVLHAPGGDERAIVNIPGLGYLFAAAVTRSAFDPGHAAACASPILGRDQTVAAIMAQLSQRRLMTITGPAGVGKTAVALCVADAVRARSGREVVWVDLSSLADASCLEAAVAAATGVAVRGQVPGAGLGTLLNGRDMLLVLDTCDHVLDAVASLIRKLLRDVPGLAVLATSRETLALQGEWVCRLAPLAVPVVQPGLTAAQAMTSAAVRLFVARATQGSDTFTFGDAQAAAVAAICAHLDGVPLAIELVASRVDLFASGQMVGGLEERLVLSVRQSGGASRHRSMRAALDWSYSRLSDLEKTVMTRLSIFQGPFSLRCAVRLAACAVVSDDDVLDAMASLTGRSLIATETGGVVPLYRLFHVTRTYAAQTPEALQGRAEARRRHAAHFQMLLAAAQHRWDGVTREGWLEMHGHTMEDVRAALEWSFSAEGDPAIAEGLVVASLPFGFQMAALDDCRRQGRPALAMRC